MMDRRRGSEVAGLVEPLPEHAAWLVDWLRDAALPLWGGEGFDRTTGLFVERFDRAGRALPDVPRRVMVQARQIFVTAVASRRGWDSSAGDRLDRAGDALVRHFLDAGAEGGWVFSVSQSGETVDGRRDLYAHAFALLALAELYRASGERRYLAVAEATLAFLDLRMASSGGGYFSALPVPPDRTMSQNPHMHLFEALLALHDATGSGAYVERADRMAELFRERFLREPGPVLAEVFDADWTVRGGPDVPFEPGHHFEWVWLLARHAAAHGTSLAPEAERLWTVALERGRTESDRIADLASWGAGPIRRTTRLWPYCEAAKAAVPMGSIATLGEVFLGGLRRRFLESAPNGSWIDHLDEDDVPLSAFAPASSLYHIVCAADEVLAAHQERQAGRA